MIGLHSYSIGKKYFGSILEGLDCVAILGAILFPFMLSFISFLYDSRRPAFIALYVLCV
jgi:hypothetical protein